MVTAMGLSDHFSIVSPITGETVRSRSGYYAHMKKHNVVPESDMRGEAEHRQAANKIAEKEQRRKTIEKIVREKL